MTDEHKECLRRNRVYLVDHMNVEPVLNYLVAADILTDREEQIIRAKVSDQCMAEELLLLLPKRNERAFSKFKQALSRTKQYTLAKLLMEPEGVTG